MTMIPCTINGVENTPVDESLLEKRVTHDDDDNRTADAVEYWLDGVMVHRTCHVTMKVGVFSLGAQGSFA
jgi:hypothetical protein